MPGTNNVTAVVVTHGRPEELRMVVAAIQSQTAPPKRLLIIDNASPTPATEVLASFKNIEIVRSDFNSGGAGGFAFGLDQALTDTCEWVWMMDDDAVPREHALERLLDAAKALPDSAGAVCTTVIEFGKTAVMHRRNFNRWVGMEFPLPETRYQLGVQQISTGSFVGFMVRANAARDIGLPNESFFLAYDDTEYSLRLSKFGWTIWLAPMSVTDHLRGSESTLRSSVFGSKHFYNIRNRIYVVRHYAKFTFLATCVATLIGTLIFLTAKSNKNWKSVHMFLKSVRDGYFGKLGPMD